MYEPSGKITRGRCIEEEDVESGGGGCGVVALEDATLLLLLLSSVLLLMVEEEENELPLEIVLVEIEKLVEFVADLVELMGETKRRASSSSPSISSH